MQQLVSTCLNLRSPAADAARWAAHMPLWSVKDGRPLQWFPKPVMVTRNTHVLHVDCKDRCMLWCGLYLHHCKTCRLIRFSFLLCSTTIPQRSLLTSLVSRSVKSTFFLWMMAISLFTSMSISDRMASICTAKASQICRCYDAASPCCRRHGVCMQQAQATQNSPECGV